MKSELDWSAYADAGMGDAYADIPKHGGDYGKAVSVCIRSGVCQRTPASGLMCPSFQVSGDPQLSPGGRVALLKTVLNQAGAIRAPLNAELRRAMDNCVSCKGCRRECENALDMARIKIEYQAQQQATPGQPRALRWRAELLAHLPHWLHRYPALKPLVRWRNRSRLLARLGERWLQLAACMTLPEPAPAPFAKYAQYRAAPEQCDLVLLIDSFAHHFEPQIADAALALLQRAGYRVALVGALADDPEPRRPLCCGRTLLSQGRVAAARVEAQRTLAALNPYLAAGKAIVGLEPSCLLTLRDEYLALELGDGARSLADAALLLEEFIAREQQAGRWTLALAHSEPVQVFPHCHQRAFGATRSLRRVLKLIRGLTFNVADSSCCGMAGHYGLEAEHQPLSTAMASAAAATLDDELPVISNGFSCRHQQQQQGHRVEHLAQFLNRCSR